MQSENRTVEVNGRKIEVPPTVNLTLAKIYAKRVNEGYMDDAPTAAWRNTSDWRRHPFALVAADYPAEADGTVPCREMK